jgi:hypothetical protein
MRLARSTVAEDYSMTQPFDTTEIEKDLYRCLAECNQFMAQSQGDEPFYGFAVMVNPVYTDISVFYNTEAKYQECLKRYLNGEFGNEYREKKAARWGLRWNPGDWSFSSEGTVPPGLSDLMEPMQKWCDYGEKWLGNDRNENQFAEVETKLLHSTCRVIDKLQAEGAIDILPRTNDFRALVGDHDDGAIQTYGRYELYKKNGSILRLGAENLVNFDKKVEEDRAVAEFRE